MVITKNELIQTIAKRSQIPAPVVRSVFAAMEEQVILSLSLAAPTQDITIKIWNGLYIHSSYEKEQLLNKGFFKNQKLSPHLRVKAETTRTLCNRVNQNRGNF